MWVLVSFNIVEMHGHADQIFLKWKLIVQQYL